MRTVLLRWRIGWGVAALCLGLATTPGSSHSQAAKGDPSEEYGVRIARVKYGGGGDWYNNPSSIPNWLAEFERRTGVRTVKPEKVLALTDENLRAYPFLYMTGHGTIKLSSDERESLRAYLEDGGFLFINDSYGLDASVHAMVRELFPEQRFEELPNDHPIYHSFYDMPGLPKIHEHDKKSPQGFGVTLDDRLAIYYVYESDIGDGLADPEVHHDTPEKREQAMKMAINVLMFAITQNALM